MLQHSTPEHQIWCCLAMIRASNCLARPSNMSLAQFVRLIVQWAWQHPPLLRSMCALWKWVARCILCADGCSRGPQLLTPSSWPQTSPLTTLLSFLPCATLLSCSGPTAAPRLLPGSSASSSLVWESPPLPCGGTSPRHAAAKWCYCNSCCAAQLCMTPSSNCGSRSSISPRC